LAHDDRRWVTVSVPERFRFVYQRMIPSDAARSRNYGNST
jgi:hypothetical protein